MIKPLAKLKEKKGEGSNQKIRNEKEQVKNDIQEIKRIIKDYYKHLYANKMDNQKEMDKLWERYNNLLRLNQKKIENMNRPVTSTEIETVILKLPKNKVQDLMASQRILSNI